ncbi:hypothetical protein [Pseudomonas sp. SJZ078]|uniref:hypothetical protein n=1 Tax=Pseudomonas sp. SJZ078 TaxID=2572886 RepID=UPI0011A010EC|nr:hypothetical protein [Pseudomonas sp. SJZ078]
MSKATLVAASLSFIAQPLAFADVRFIDEQAVIKAIHAPILKQVKEEDSPGCMTTRYTFGDKVFDMKLEFKCDRINVAWTGSDDPKNKARVINATVLAKKAVSALTDGSGIEVERVLSGGIYKSRTFDNGLVLRSGSCAMNACLLTFN